MSRRVVFRASGRPLELWDVDVPAPEAGGLLVRTVLAGVCGTDAHRLAGDLPDPAVPVAFGHEGVGRIEELGDGTTVDSGGEPVAVGDLVYWTPSGDPARPGPGLPWPPPADRPSVAAYQDLATLSPATAFYRVPAGTSADAVIAFGCALPTALGGMTRLGGVRPGSTVVVQGCGPVGLAATLLAGQAGAGQVIVIGAPDDRLRAAERLGATAVLPLAATSAEERLSAVRDLTGRRGADVVVEATGRIEAFPEGLTLLAVEGRYLILGIYSGQGVAPIDVVTLTQRSQQVIGSLGPARLEDLRTTIALARDHGERLGFADLIGHRAPLERTADAIAAVGSGAVIKAVVEP